MYEAGRVKSFNPLSFLKILKSFSYRSKDTKKRQSEVDEVLLTRFLSFTIQLIIPKNMIVVGTVTTLKTCLDVWKNV